MDDKLMFKEITELNEERKRINQDEAVHSIRLDPKKSLNRLSIFVDEVHDIMMTLKIKDVMQYYWEITEGKIEALNDLTKMMTTIKLIPPSILPRAIRE